MFLPLGVVIYGVDDLEISLIIDLRFAFEKVLAELAHFQVELGHHAGNVFVGLLVVGRTDCERISVLLGLAQSFRDRP